MKVIDSERTIEGAHAPGAPPLDAQQLNFDRAGEASVDQTDSPADNKTVPTQLAHSGRQHATRTTPKRGTAVGYIRVSTEDQTQGYSLDAQRAGIQEYCERNGYQLVRIYADEGVSAHTDKISKRPQLSLLLEHATQGQFDVVVVHTLDRWARNMRVHVEALQRLIDARVGFASVTEDIDFNTAIGRVMMALLAAFAEFFSSQLGEHVKKAVKQRAAQGLQNGSAPFGYLRDDETGIPCPVPEEAEAVRTVFAKRAAGETSGKIAVWLNAAGFRTRRGNTFTDGSVRDMLGFRFYLGVVRLGDEEFPGQHEGIIAPELFERVQTRTVKRGPALHTAGGARGLLAGIIRCGHCGDRLQADRNSSGNPLYRERPVFVCKTEGEPGALGCKTAGKSRVASHIDAQMGDIFGSLVLPQDWKQRIARQSVRTEGPSVSDLQGRRLRLGRSYRDETITEEEYQREREELDAQLRIAQLSTTIELDEVAELLENLAELWGAAKPDERRRLLRTLVEAVHVDIESKCIVGITPVPAFTKLIESAMERTAGCRAVLYDPKKVENLESIGLLGTRQDRPLLPRVVEGALQLVGVLHEPEPALRVGVVEGIRVLACVLRRRRCAAGGELEQCLGGLAWKVVRELEERVFGGGSRLVEPLWRHPVAEQVVVRHVVEEPRLGRRRRCGLSDGQLPRDVARHLDLADGFAHLDDLRGARARVALDHPALGPLVRSVVVVRVAEQQARVGPMHDQAQIAADARRPEVPVFALVDAVELRAGVCRVELQVEGRGLRRPLLVRGQPGEARRERVGDPELH